MIEIDLELLEFVLSLIETHGESVVECVSALVEATASKFQELS